MKIKIRPIISYTILFIESISLFLLTVILSLRLNILNSKYIIKQFEKNNYYETLYEEIKTEMTYYTSQSGFEDDIIDDTFTVADVKADTNSFINNIYSGRKIDINTDFLKEKFKEKVENYITINNLTVTDENEITTFIDKMASIYSNEIKLMDYLDKTATIISKIVNLSTNIIVLLLVDILLLTIINKKVFKRTHFETPFFTSAFLFICVNVYIKTHLDISNFFIYSNLVSSVIKSTIKNLLHINMMIIIAYMIIGILLSLSHKRKVYRK